MELYNQAETNSIAASVPVTTTTTSQAIVGRKIDIIVQSKEELINER